MTGSRSVQRGVTLEITLRTAPEGDETPTLSACQYRYRPPKIPVAYHMPLFPRFMS